MRSMFKKTTAIFVSLALVLIMIPFRFTTNVVAASGEYAYFPGDVLKVTQGAYGSYSHNGTFKQNAFDLGGNTNYYAPFTGTITKIKTSYNAVVLQSENKVHWSNGDYDYMSVTFVHDNDISDLYVGKRINQGDIFYQSGSKDPTGKSGVHVHICVNKGLTDEGIRYFSGDVTPNDAFYLKPTTSIVQTGNYQWKTKSSENIVYSSISKGTYGLKNKGTGLYASLSYAKDAQGQNIDTYKEICPFEITKCSTTGGYKIRPTWSKNRVLNVYTSASVSSGNNVCIWDNTNHASQRWYFQKVSGGYVIRSVQNPNCVLDIKNGWDVYVSTYTGAKSQIWALEKYQTTTGSSSNTSSNTSSTIHKHSYVSVITSKATPALKGKIAQKCSGCGSVKSVSYFGSLKTIKLSTTSYYYNGKSKKPTVTVKDSNGKTIAAKYYTVSYPSGRKNVGKYKVTIKFKGNYSGTVYRYFTIKPPKTSIKKITANKKILKISVNKKTTQVTGYQIQYSTSKKFESPKTINIKDDKTTSVTIKKLKSKKTYYVRVRTYKTAGGKKYYSGWSGYKSKKTK